MYKNNSLTVKFVRLHPNKDNNISMPKYMTKHSSGMDIFAAIENSMTIMPSEIKLIPTGFAMAIPDGYEAQIRPRSGLALKHGISIINTPGTIDSDYRGEIKVALINFGKKPFTLHRGNRIAQIVFNRVYHVKVDVVEKLNKTNRNKYGFGHTGI